MRRCATYYLILILAIAAGAQAAPIFTGSLSSATGGLVGTGAWVSTPSSPATLSWTVSQNPDYSWHYDYTISVPVGDLSHAIFEASEDLKKADILNAVGPFTALTVKDHKEQQGNPNLPETFHGIKFDHLDGLVARLQFDCFRVPVWGDFFAKDGKAGHQGVNTIWNAGFTSPDSDPLVLPGNGSVGNHVLVPDTFIIPEPATGVSLALSLLALGCRRRRRR